MTDPRDIVLLCPHCGQPEASQTPIDMVLFCPSCCEQHVDEPDQRPPGWTNPPHRSHLCHTCGFIWRPCDLPTNGVYAIKTRGKDDHLAASRHDDALAEAQREARRHEKHVEELLAEPYRREDGLRASLTAAQRDLRLANERANKAEKQLAEVIATRATTGGVDDG